MSEDKKKANITPVSKRGRREDPGNYRLVSITSVSGKVMEQLILKTISMHKKGDLFLYSTLMRPHLEYQ